MGRFKRTLIFSAPRRAALALASVLAVAVSLMPSPSAAAVYVNEILPNPVGTDTGTERVEVYNSGPGSVDMTGWAIDDAVTIGQVATRARIPEDLDASCSTSAIIGPGEFRVVMMTSGAAVLNNTGDDVYLVSNRVLAATVVHNVTYPATVGEGQVWAALPNGTASFAWRTPTLCASNGGPIGDVTPPATVLDLDADPGDAPGEIRLAWTAPGDDGAVGTASAYSIKVSHDPITAGTFDASADLDRWILEPFPHVGGTPETLYVFGLDPDSTWYFALHAQDEVPNTSAVSNTVGSLPRSGTLLPPDLGYSAYFGNLHSHSSYSDGVQTPADAYAFARLSAPTPLDFLAVTDHNHSGAGMQLPSYALGQAAANAANDDGNFVAIWGQEWGIIATGGHANVFEAPALFGWEAGNYDVFVAQGDYTGLYTAYLANPPANYTPFVEWCHPASGDFNSYAVTDDGKNVVSLMALITGPAFSTSVTESDVGSTTGNEQLFQAALRKGFRVSPAGDQDNHQATWGAATQTRTVALAAGRTKSEIMNALALGRNYASQDHNTVVQFSADGRPMGSAWTSPGAEFAVNVIDPDVSESVAQIDLFRGITGVSDAVVVASSVGNSSFHWRERTPFADNVEAHYYLRIRMSDNANIWTGPVYVTHGDAGGTVAVGEGGPGARIAMAASPNPTLGQVTASFTLPGAVSRGQLVVFDVGGRRVKTLLDGPLTAGEHRIGWSGHADDGTQARPGVYFIRLVTPEHSATKKILLIR